MSAAEYKFQSRHNDRLLRRLTIDDGRPTRAESAAIALSCFGLALLTLWVCL
jgi:hypothetical protein